MVECWEIFMAFFKMTIYWITDSEITDQEQIDSFICISIYAY